jgi:hypothetical protein
MVHPPKTFPLRPSVEKLSGQIENLTLAADYVQNATILATMEGANESARRAVRVILQKDGASPDPVNLFPLEEPREYLAARKLDEVRYSGMEDVSHVLDYWVPLPDGRGEAHGQQITPEFVAKLEKDLREGKPVSPT